jgi:hypothetical protein
MASECESLPMAFAHRSMRSARSAGSRSDFMRCWAAVGRLVLLRATDFAMLDLPIATKLAERSASHGNPSAVVARVEFANWDRFGSRLSSLGRPPSVQIVGDQLFYVRGERPMVGRRRFLSRSLHGGLEPQVHLRRLQFLGHVYKSALHDYSDCCIEDCFTRQAAREDVGSIRHGPNLDHGAYP